MAIFSLMAVYSATGSLAYQKYGGNTEAYLIKHGVILMAGLFLTYVFHLMHYLRFSKWAPVLMVIVIPLLMYTIAFGVERNDAHRWIDIPLTGLTFQPSELAKLALIMYVARAISSKQEYIKDFQEAFLPIIVPVLIICGLIAPANLSTAIILFFTCMFMMFVGRVDLKYVGLLLFLGIVLFSFLYTLGNFFPEIVRVHTWTSRVAAFMEDSGDVAQVTQAKIAIANGNLFGLGPGNSIQRNFLYVGYSDFIYAIICEEYGVFGGALLIGLYVLLFFRATRLVTKSPKAFGAMLAMGLSILLIMQAFVNIAVSVNLIPVTGVTLPMISYGGTSLVFTCVAFGIILSVSKYIESVT
ncbi:MAG: FtsW/RodA/SpoVE family cell cycle protein [Saprospiraceae bacterium]|nr:FtsW/RodA/SpoVE family cell cycle protein [Saprospiraceae bacterium]